MLAKRQLAEFVYDAVNLEGINFTLPEIQTLLDGITVGGHKLTDQQIALNQGNTWRTLFDQIEKDQFEITYALRYFVKQIDKGCYQQYHESMKVIMTLLCRQKQSSEIFILE